MDTNTPQQALQQNQLSSFLYTLECLLSIPFRHVRRFLLFGDMKKYFAQSKDSPYNKKFSYGVRICPEPVHWGGLSGCTYSEGVSWGKFVPEAEGGRYAEVLVDATVAWPIVVKAVLERLGKR